MYISKVSLVNYRNFKYSTFLFKKGINTLIGENASGKTNIFRAIRLLLDDSILKYAYKLTESDFNRSLGINNWKGHWIIISIEFDEITDDESIQSLFAHGTGQVTQDKVQKASYNLFFRPNASVRKKLSELTPGDQDGLKNIISQMDIDIDYETVFTGKSTVNFSNPDVYKELVGDFDSVVFPEKIDSSKFGVKIPHQLSVSKEVSFTFITALRDVMKEFNNNRSNPLLKLLTTLSGEIKEEDYQPISELVDDLNEKIETLDGVQTVRDDIKNTIRDTVGQTYSPSSLSIKSSLPNEANKLLQSLKLFISESTDDYEGGINELSLGGANLLFLTLKLLEYKYQKSKNTIANFLIIEEPEAHIHNHIQKTLFDKLDYGDTQIIYSTHSTQISEVSNVSNINILAKKENVTEVFQPATGLSEKNIQEIQRYLDAVRCNLLFAKGIVLVEGDAEEILIPQIVKQVLGVSLDELGISIVNIRSTGFKNVAQLFHDNRIRRKCSIITDLDDAICDVNILPTDGDAVKKYKTKVKNSMTKGLERQAILTEFEENNQWIKTFYAKHTFEVDFVKSGNIDEVIETVDQIYTDATTKTNSINELSSADTAVYGKRILTMANHEGKGWFAILLGENLTFKTKIPDYILNAIIFSMDKFTTGIIEDIVSYRIRKYEENGVLLDTCKEELQKYKQRKISMMQLRDELSKYIPDDQILDLIERIQ